MTQSPADDARIPRRDDADALFVPLLQDRPTAAGKPPWRPSSLIFPAFFGGPVAATILAVLNARRFGERSASTMLLALGSAAFAALVISELTLDLSGSRRFFVAGSGLIVYGAQLWLLRSADRVHQLRGGTYESLWGPGFAVVALSAIVTGGALYAAGGAS